MIKFHIIIILGLGSLTSIVQICRADTIGTDRVKLIDSLGTIQKKSNTGDFWDTVGIDEFVPVRGVLRSGEYAAALLQLNDRNFVRLGENTLVELVLLGDGHHYHIKLITGKIWISITPADKLTSFVVSCAQSSFQLRPGVYAVANEGNSSCSALATLAGGAVVFFGPGKTSVNAGDSLTLSRQHFQQGASAEKRRIGQMWKYLKAREDWLSTKQNLRLDKDFEVKCRSWFAVGKQSAR